VSERERCRANNIDARRGGEADFDRNREIALHLLSRLAWRLCRDFQNNGCRIRVSFDVKSGKCEQPGDYKYEQAQKDQRTPG
jgi:hypothetical protein